MVTSRGLASSQRAAHIQRMSGPDNLQKQHEAFRKAMQSQPTILRPPAATPDSGMPPDLTTRRVPSPSPSLASSTTTGGRPVNSYVHAVLAYLKGVERPVSFGEILQKLNIDLSLQTDILDRVLRNERVSYDEDDSTLEYHAMFAIRTKDDVITLLKQRPNLSGVEYAELKESTPHIDEFITELVRERQVFLVRAKEDGPKVVFLNDTRTRGPVDEVLRQLWASTTVPHDEQELRRELEAVGLKPHGRSIERAGQVASPKPGLVAGDKEKRKNSAKRPFRKIKITNDYLDNIDLNIDPTDL